MKYEEIKTGEELTDFVKCFWASETLTKKSIFTILPDGYFDLIVEIRNNKISNIKLTGIWTIPINVETEVNTKIFAVRFKLIAIELLESINLKPLLNSSANVSTDLFGIGSKAFENFSDFCTHMERYLKNRIAIIKTVNDWKLRLFNEIYKGEVFSVQELSEKVFWTSRQINRYFNSTFGLSLKEYLNIIRCNQTYNDIANGKLRPNGKYFDQSHFIKEIKKFTGVTPTELSKNENDRFLQLLTLKRN
jgi:AraC-like DNA-binding protein